MIQQFDFTPQRNFLDVQFVQGGAEQFAQLQQNIFCSLRIIVNQRHSRLERIEQKMRLQLPSQSFELRLGQSRLELSRAQLAPPRLVSEAVKLRPCNQ